MYGIEDRIVPPGIRIVWVANGWDYSCDECGMNALCGVWANADAAIHQAQKHSLEVHWPVTWRAIQGNGLLYPLIELLTGR